MIGGLLPRRARLSYTARASAWCSASASELLDPLLQLSAARRAAAILWPEFIERDGVVMLARVPAVEPAPGETLTAFERLQGHTHLQDVFRWRVPYIHDADWDVERPDTSSTEFAEVWELAKQMGRMWLAKLRADFPRYRFRVYVSKLDDPIIHFHRVRPSEPVWISDEDAAAQIDGGEFVIYDSAAEYAEPAGA